MTSIQSLPALVAGLLLLVAGIALWLLLSSASVTKNLFAKLPEDSRIAGVARLAAFDYGTLEQVSSSAAIYPDETKAFVSLVRSAVSPELLAKALGGEVGFAQTPDGHTLAVVTVRDEALYSQLADAIGGRLDNAKPVAIDTPERGSLTFSGGRLPGTKITVLSYREGSYVYFATDQRLILGALEGAGGFDRHDRFADVSNDLPGSQDAYVFLDGSLSERYPRLKYDLVGLAIENDERRLKIEAVNAVTPQAQEALGRTSGNLLPPVSAAPVSISGTNVLKFLRLLEEQRSEEDLPGVLRFQNGVSSVDRQLGIDLERDYLAAADGAFVYARYRDGDARHWMGLLEFGSPETARGKTDELQKLLKAKAKVPVRREVVKVLPDGTRSREIESQRNEPLSVRMVTVEGQPAGSARLPSMGRAVWQVRDRYLLIGSSEEAVARLVRSLVDPSPADARGQLVVRAALAEAATVTGGEDGLFGWILFTRPGRGSFALDKATGELTGDVTFAER
ncbi:MAG: hypothetical protein WD926_00195 [Patescibacteria group bacterium]